MLSTGLQTGLPFKKNPQHRPVDLSWTQALCCLCSADVDADTMMTFVQPMGEEVILYYEGINHVRDISQLPVNTCSNQYSNPMLLTLKLQTKCKKKTIKSHNPCLIFVLQFISKLGFSNLPVHCNRSHSGFNDLDMSHFNIFSHFSSVSTLKFSDFSKSD